MLRKSIGFQWVYVKSLWMWNWRHCNLYFIRMRIQVWTECSRTKWKWLMCSIWPQPEEREKSVKNEKEIFDSLIVSKATSTTSIVSLQICMQYAYAKFYYYYTYSIASWSGKRWCVHIEFERANVLGAKRDKINGITISGTAKRKEEIKPKTICIWISQFI